MEGRVLKAENVANKEQRGLRTAFTGDQLRYDEKIQDREVKVSLRDTLNQGINIEGKRNEERIKIQSKHRISRKTNMRMPRSGSLMLDRSGKLLS